MFVLTLSPLQSARTSNGLFERWWAEQLQRQSQANGAPVKPPIPIPPGKYEDLCETTPGMFVNVALKMSAGTQLVVPASGVLQSGTRQIVFVNRGEGYLDPREVELGARVGEDFVVLKGLKEGEEIVTAASFRTTSRASYRRHSVLRPSAPPVRERQAR